jgi:hypothetical protein
MDDAGNPSGPRRGSTWARRSARAASGASCARSGSPRRGDGKRIKAALERALALDPGMHDASFGIGA